MWNLAGRSYADMAAYLASEIMDDMDPEILRKAVHEAYDFPIVLRHLDGKLYTLELFHGPTFAFKDFGARFMGRVAAMLNGGRGLTVLAATSGDTGSAVANGFLDVEGIDVVVLYPKGKVSEIQEKQFTTLGRNITALEIDGTFDDCQRLVKAAFMDRAPFADLRQFDQRRALPAAGVLLFQRLCPVARGRPVGTDRRQRAERQFWQSDGGTVRQKDGIASEAVHRGQ